MWGEHRGHFSPTEPPPGRPLSSARAPSGGELLLPGLLPFTSGISVKTMFSIHALYVTSCTSHVFPRSAQRVTSPLSLFPDGEAEPDVPRGSLTVPESQALSTVGARLPHCLSPSSPEPALLFSLHIPFPWPGAPACLSPLGTSEARWWPPGQSSFSRRVC